MLEEIHSSEDEEIVEMDSSKNNDTCNQSLCSAFRNTITNWTYNLKHSNIMAIPMIQRKAVSLKKNGAKAYLLGTSYEYDTQNFFLQRFQKTIWISYRSGIQKIQGDAGWGCMIRVVQMVFAQIFQRHLHQDAIDVLNLFKEGINVPFSLLNICQIGNINQRWTSCTEIMSIMKRLIQQQQQYKLNVDLYSGGIAIPEYSKADNVNGGRVIVISTKINQQNIPEDYYQHLKHLMRHQHFCGSIGGISGQALFILGFYQDQAIILDPHYVQKVQSHDDSITYFKKTPRSVHFSKLSTTIAFCYYLPDQQRYHEWVTWLIHANTIYSPLTIFDIQVEHPETWLNKFRKISQDDFEDLLQQ